MGASPDSDLNLEVQCHTSRVPYEVSVNTCLKVLDVFDQTARSELLEEPSSASTGFILSSNDTLQELANMVCRLAGKSQFGWSYS